MSEMVQSMTTTKKKNFYITDVLEHRVNKLISITGMNFSEITRQALNDYLDKIEVARLEAEANEALKDWYEDDINMAAEWRSAEGKIE